jgi:hypothetical protein
VQPGDHLRHPGGPAGQLEHRHVVGVDAGLDVVDDLAGEVGRGVGAEVLDPDARRVRRGADGQHVPQRRMPGPLLSGEADQIEALGAGLDQVRHGAGTAADPADFVRPVGG